MQVELPYRRSCRALLVDGTDRILLAEHRIDAGTVWTAPGGGVEGDESVEETLARELVEETGLRLAGGVVRDLAWVQTAPLTEMRELGFAGVRNEVYLVRVPRFEPLPGPGCALDGIVGMRWWSAAEIRDATRDGTLFSPRDLERRLPELLAVVAQGRRPEPVEIDGF